MQEDLLRGFWELRVMNTWEMAKNVLHNVRVKTVYEEALKEQWQMSQAW